MLRRRGYTKIGGALCSVWSMEEEMFEYVEVTNLSGEASYIKFHNIQLIEPVEEGSLLSLELGRQIVTFKCKESPKEVIDAMDAQERAGDDYWDEKRDRRKAKEDESDAADASVQVDSEKKEGTEGADGEG